MRWCVVLAILGAGCSFRVAPAIGGDAGDDARDGDAIEPDAPDAPAICTTWHPHNFDPCAIGTPKPALTITAAASPWTYETTTSGGTLRDNTGTVLMSSVVVPQVNGPMLAVLNVDALTVEVGATLFVVGDKPLLVASWSTITIGGLVDAGSFTAEVDNNMNAHIDGPTRIGAGARTAACTGLAGAAGSPAVASGGSGGGGGGAFRGNGGNGTTGDTTHQPGGPGGVKLSAAPSIVRAGCNGGASGNAGASTGLTAPATSSSESLGGPGGGAIQLAARVSLAISNGTINAGGAGGAGAPQGSAVGGGGGGSGGYIALDAPMVSISASVVAANGGGGGGAAGYGDQGTQGANAISAAQALGGPARPTPPATCGLAGANGSVAGTLDGANATGMDACGGGGGGGGAGFIFVWSPAVMKQNATLSPAELP